MEITTATMYAELIRLMSKKGVDPSEFALMPYGGAGPTHGFMLAHEVGIRQVIVPPTPGLMCALGCLTSDVKIDFVKTLNLFLSSNPESNVGSLLGNSLRDLTSVVMSHMAHEGPGEVRIEGSADMCYRGQSYEINVPMDPQSIDDVELVEALVRDFHTLHKKIYGHSDPGTGVELLNIRVGGIRDVPKPTPEELANIWRRRDLGDGRPRGRREVIFGGGRISAAIYDRDRLRANDQGSGPAVIEQYDSTTFVPPGFNWYVDRLGNLIGEKI